MIEIPPLWRGPALTLLRCPRCGGWPYRVNPGTSTWCWRCQQWLSQDEPKPKVAPMGLWESIWRTITKSREDS